MCWIVYAWLNSPWLILQPCGHFFLSSFNGPPIRSMWPSGVSLEFLRYSTGVNYHFSLHTSVWPDFIVLFRITFRSSWLNSTGSGLNDLSFRKMQGMEYTHILFMFSLLGLTLQRFVWRMKLFLNSHDAAWNAELRYRFLLCYWCQETVGFLIPLFDSFISACRSRSYICKAVIPKSTEYFLLICI